MEPTWRGPKVPPTKNRNFLGFGPRFLVNPAILFSFFSQLLYFISVFTSGGTFYPDPPWLRPCCWAYQFRGNSLRHDTGAKYTVLTMETDKCRRPCTTAVWSPYTGTIFISRTTSTISHIHAVAFRIEVRLEMIKHCYGKETDKIQILLRGKTVKPL